MKPLMKPALCFAVALLAVLAPLQALAGLKFAVSFDAGVRASPVSGRLVVYLIRPGAKVGERAQPSDAPFFGDPQPCAGIDVKELAPGSKVIVDDGAAAYPEALSKLPKGSYRVQAVLDQVRDNSNWRREAGNLYSKTVTVEIDPALEGVHAIVLTEVTKPRTPSPVEGAEIFEHRSKMLSEFHGRDIVMKVGVVKPIDWQEGRSYAAVYEVPGYGGDSRTALMIARGRTPERVASMPQAEHELWSAAFRIVLDPESGTGTGHTLFADSDNNGPWSRALVEELIPALEAKYGLIRRAEARLIAGHSSGGWSSLWLQLTHPNFFGGAWPSAPDPVDFRAFQRTNIYEDAGIYLDTRGDDPTKPTPSFTTLSGEVTMTVRTENLVEEVIGPRNTSGQQWDSWKAVFGPRGADGLPADLFDPRTGMIDRTVAEAFRRYDIGELLRKNPEKIGRVFREKVRLIVGDADNYGLELAVMLLDEDLQRLCTKHGIESGAGYVKVLPGDHGTVMANPEARNARAEMIECLRASGVLEK